MAQARRNKVYNDIICSVCKGHGVALWRTRYDGVTWCDNGHVVVIVSGHHDVEWNAHTHAPMNAGELLSEIQGVKPHEWEPDFSEGEPARDSKVCGLCGKEHAPEPKTLLPSVVGEVPSQAEQRCGNIMTMRKGPILWKRRSGD